MARNPNSLKNLEKGKATQFKTGDKAASAFLLLKYRLTFAAGIKNKIDVMNAIIGKKELPPEQ